MCSSDLADVRVWLDKLTVKPSGQTEYTMAQLSGGNQQKVILARWLRQEPEVLILDEPTSALDVLTQANIFNVLKRIKKELGTSFDLREFHEVVLRNGAVPLSVLEQQVENYLAAKKQGSK